MTAKLLFFNILILFSVLNLSSCKTREKLVYFQHSDLDSSSKTLANYTPIFKYDDFLSIIVLGEDPEAVVPFNLPPVVGTSTTSSGYSSGNPVMSGYLIDSKGTINFPFLGEIKLAGLNRMEATEMIEEKLKEYITNPVIHIHIQNFKITVLGNVNSPGTFKIPNERISIIEAIGLAGDLKMTGKRNNVLVIRDNNGVKEEYRLDLTSTEVFTSPVYYLNQNDVVYVEPNATARSESTIWRTTGPIFISLTSLVLTTVALLFR